MTKVGPLQLRDRKGHATVEPVEGGIRLTAEVEWQLKGAKEDIDSVQHALGAIVERIDDRIAFLNFGNSVGWFEAPPLGRIEVRSGKWTVEHFNRMLRELSEIASALPFSSSQRSALPYDRNVPVAREILYHAFVYLRHVVLEAQGDANLATAYRVVLADPHQRLGRTQRIIDPALARSVGPRALEEVIAGRHHLYRAPAGCTAPLALALRGHLPETITEDVTRREVDTPENRFAKALLGQALWIVEEIGQRLASGKTGHPEQIRRQASAIRQVLEPIARHGFWRGIGQMVTIPEASTVLQRRRGYRELFGHFAALRLASRVPLSARDVTRLLEAKDIATLYELWCFYKVVDEVEKVEGKPSRAETVEYTAFDATVHQGCRISWPAGVVVAYNPRFAQADKTRRSYSVPLRPDISLRVPDGRPNAGLHLLDAKFKIDNLGELLRKGLPDDPDELGDAGFIRADLYKMHTYRDAIPNARSVWILYPGTQFASFDAQLRSASPESPVELEHPIEGVGAVPLRPETGGDTVLGHLVTALLSPLRSQPGSTVPGRSSRDAPRMMAQGRGLMPPANRADWNTRPLPSSNASIPLGLRFSASEMDRIRHGLVPEQMEDKWFIFFEDDSLYFHRSWTGFCLFKVRFEVAGGGFLAVDALVNRDPEQYSSTDDDHDRKLVQHLINVLLLKRSSTYPSLTGDSSIAAALEQWSMMGRASLGPEDEDTPEEDGE